MALIPMTWRMAAASLTILALVRPLPAQTVTTRDREAFVAETEQLRRDNPQLYQAVRESFTLLAEMLLGRLGYDVGPFDGVLDNRTRDAVRRYQRDHKLPENGDPFTFDTVQAVRADDELLDSAPIFLQPKTVILDRWDRGFVSADGTWTVVGDVMASPEQTSNITCERAEAICREARATISGRGSERFLSVDLYTFEIDVWSDQEIVTKPLQFGCNGTVHRWERAGAALTAVRSTTSTEGSCRAVERIESRLVLENGNEVSRKLFERQRDAWRRIVQISPATIRRLAEPDAR